MKVLKSTPRTELQRRSITHRANGLVEKVAEDLQIDPDYAWIGLDTFALLSTRVEFAPEEIDFELAVGSDDAEEIERKFYVYLDSESTEARTEAARRITAMDAAVEEAIAPQPPEASDEKN